MLAATYTFLVGAFGNWTVRLQNGGMPAPISAPLGKWVPMAGARLPWLGDHIVLSWRGGQVLAVSPGDVLMTLGLLMLAVASIHMAYRLLRH